jgi:NADP-dependent 3-hydroxy acid dehydrogenase YdfG
VSAEEEVIRAAAETDAAWGRVDALINNAGWMPGSRRILDLDAAVLDRVLRSNPISSFLTTKHFGTVAIAPGLTDTPGMRAIVGDDYIESVASRYQADGWAGPRTSSR